ncbi:MAG: lipopolysaccharide biosynthesis protein, partial [Loktanella sp.]|nr:lipopolysaccharide biosynthesis protein [Loktanella sp.]
MSDVVGDTLPETDAAAAPVRGLATADRGRKAIFGLGWSALNTLSATIIAATVFVVTSRLLGPNEFGIVALAVSMITFVGCATPAAFGEAIMQRAEIADAHLDTVFWMCLISGVILYLPILLLAGPVAAWTQEPVLALLLPVIGVKLVIDLAVVVPQALVIRAMQFKYITARTAIGNGAGGVVCIIMALNGYGLWALAMAPVITSVVSAVILIRAARWWPGFRIKASAARDLMRFGLFSSGNRILTVINLDQILLGFIAGPAVLGLYFLGKRLHDLLSGITSGALYPVATVFFATIQQEPSHHTKPFTLITRVAALATFPIFSGLFVLADTAIPLALGNHWQPAIPVIEAFAMIGFLFGLHVSSASLASGLGRADLWFFFELIRYGLTLTVIVLLIGRGLNTVMTGIVVVNALIAP